MARITKNQRITDELKLLAELQKDAHANINTIANHCGFTRQKAWRLIKQLEEKNQIWGYTAIFNDERMGVKHYTMLVKRNSNNIRKQIIDQIVSRKLEDTAELLGVTVENSYYVHGEYDWILTFTAKDILHARQFSEVVAELNPGIIEKISIVQTMMFMRKQHILNPDRHKLLEII